MSKPETMMIDEVKYVRADAVSEPAESFDGMEYMIVRTYSAGVFAGYVQSRNGQEAVIRNARRLWYWDGAASLSQLAMEGVTKPQNCKFAMEVDKITVTQAVELLSVTKQAQKNIAEVPVWKK